MSTLAGLVAIPITANALGAAARLFGVRGGRALTVVVRFAGSATAAAVLVGPPAVRLVVVAVAGLAFAAVAWVYVLDDVERAGLRRLWA